MNVCEQNQPLAAFLHFFTRILYQAQFILQSEREIEIYTLYFCNGTKSKRTLLISCSFLSFLLCFILNCEAEFFYVVYRVRCVQGLTAVLKSVMKGKVQYVLSPAPFTLVNQLIVKSFKIFLSTNKIVNKILDCPCCLMSYRKFNTVPRVILIFYIECYWHTFPSFTDIKFVFVTHLLYFLYNVNKENNVGRQVGSENYALLIG